MKPELGKSQFHAPIFDGAKVEEAARAMPVGEVSVSSLLETFPVLMWATTPDGVPWYLNQRCVEYTGRSLSDTLSLGWVDVIHPEDREETVRAWSHAVSSGSSHHVKQRLRRADGEYQWFLTLAEPLRDREGRAIHFVGLSVDINESVKREAEIRRLFGANIVGIVFWEIDGEIRDANDAFLRMVGYERADVVSGRLRWTDLMTAEWLKLDCEYAEQRVRLTESVQPYETEFLRKNGSRVPVLIGGAAFDAEIKHRVTFVVDITARKRAEEESRRSQHYLAEAQRLSQTGSFGWRPDSGEVIWSAETYRIFEYDRAVTPTIDLVVQRVHPEDRAEFQSVIERAFEGASDFEHAYRLLLPDGRAKYVRALAHATRDASGNREFVGAVTDMTDPKRAEESLRASEAYLAEAQRLSRTGSWAWSPDEDIRYWSEECYRVLSFDPNDGLPRFEEFFQRIHPDDQPRCKELVETAAREKAPFESDYRIVHPDGPVRDIHVLGRPVLDTSGHLVEFVGTVIDVTDRRHREQRMLAQYRVTQALSEANSLRKAAPGILRAMCEALQWDLGALWQVDPEGGVLRCIATWAPPSAAPSNLAAATRAITFGPGMGLPGRVWSSGGPVCIRDVALDPELPRAKPAAKEGLHAAFAFPVILKSGIVGVVELFSREVREADRGLLQMMAAIGSQIAQFIERTRASDALRDAREKVAHSSKIASLAELSASIAHEINQPLQAIVANGHASLRWLDAKPPNIEKAIQTARRVVHDGKAAAEIVSRIRALFKHAAPAKVDFDINKLILEVRTLMGDEIQGGGVSFETELGEELPRIRADAVQIQQVIVNLVRNAIEAMAATMESPKPLWIRSRREGRNVVVDVQDHGVGLADSEKIFEPFNTTKETGLGMGLAICRSIMEAHAGRIWATRNPERGVTFSFSLPIDNSVTG